MLKTVKPLMMSLVLVVGCSLNLEPMMLSYPQTDKAVRSLNDHPQGRPLAELDSQIREFRRGLVVYALQGLIDIETAHKVDHHLKIADYYCAVGWVHMIEGKDPQAALDLGLKALEDAQSTIVKEVSPVKETEHQI